MCLWDSAEDGLFVKENSFTFWSSDLPSSLFIILHSPKQTFEKLSLFSKLLFMNKNRTIFLLILTSYTLPSVNHISLSLFLKEQVPVL